MTRQELESYIVEKYGDLMKPLETGKYDPLFVVEVDKLVEVAQKLKADENLKFDFLCNACGVDTGQNFEAVYNIASMTKNLRLDFKVILPYDKAEVDTLQSVWPAIGWYEREMWELYGINVKNHGNLTRFLLPDDWDQGFPMRKNWDAPDFVRLPEK